MIPNGPSFMSDNQGHQDCHDGHSRSHPAAVLQFQALEGSNREGQRSRQNDRYSHGTHQIGRDYEETEQHEQGYVLPVPFSFPGKRLPDIQIQTYKDYSERYDHVEHFAHHNHRPSHESRVDNREKAGCKGYPDVVVGDPLDNPEKHQDSYKEQDAVQDLHSDDVLRKQEHEQGHKHRITRREMSVRHADGRDYVPIACSFRKRLCQEEIIDVIAVGIQLRIKIGLIAGNEHRTDDGNEHPRQEFPEGPFRLLPFRGILFPC